jgi:hypothetical protein
VSMYKYGKELRRSDRRVRSPNAGTMAQQRLHNQGGRGGGIDSLLFGP